MPFGLGEYVESALKPHLIYARRQGTTLAFAAVFGLTALLFAALSLFLALTYLMAPIWAALLCTVACALVAAIALMIVQRRARVRAHASAAVIAAEAGHEPEMTIARVRALSAFASSILPAIAIGAVAFFIGRRKERPRGAARFPPRARL